MHKHKDVSLKQKETNIWIWIWMSSSQAGPGFQPRHLRNLAPSPADTWWRHQMETFSMLLALCAGNSLVTVEFPSQRPVTQSFGVFFDLHLNKRMSKPSRRQWFEMPLRSLWCHCNAEYPLTNRLDYPRISKLELDSEATCIHQCIKGIAPCAPTYRSNTFVPLISQCRVIS